MLEGWRQRRAEKKATDALLKNPIVQAGREAINSYWSNVPLVRQQHSKEFVANIANQLFERVVQVATAQDPVAANRNELAGMTTEAARYQVLILEPAPVPDPTGLRGRLGISGELRPHLCNLLLVDKHLAEEFHESPDRSDETIYSLCLIRYRQCHAAAHVLSHLRFVLGDYNKNAKLDWFRPFYFVHCAASEAHYRLQLDLPSDLDPVDAVTYSTMTNFVTAGHKWPDLAWEQHYDRKLPRLP